MMCPRCSANIANDTDTCAYCGATVREAPPMMPQMPPMQQAPPTVIIQNNVQAFPFAAQEPPRPVAPYVPPPVPKKPFYKTWWFWLLAIVFGIPLSPFLALPGAIAWAVYLLASRRLFAMSAGKIVGTVIAILLLVLFGFAGINALMQGSGGGNQPDASQESPPKTSGENVAAGPIETTARKPTGKPTPTPRPKPTPSPSPIEAPAEVYALGPYSVSILGARITKDANGKPAATVSYEWTNNSDDTTSFLFAINAKCFQDGVQIETTIVDERDMEQMLLVKPGGTQTVVLSYLVDPKKPFEIEVVQLFDLEGDAYTQTFTPAD